MIQATLRVGYLELKRVVPGYRLSKCTSEFIKDTLRGRPYGRYVLRTSRSDQGDLQEAMASYFVRHHLQATP